MGGSCGEVKNLSKLTKIQVQLGRNVKWTDVLYSREEAQGKYGRFDREHLLRFCAGQYVPEIPKFLMDVHQYKTMKDDAARTGLAKQIFEEFIVEDAPNEVNITAVARSRCIAMMMESNPTAPAPIDLFDDAKGEIEEIMRADTWPNFVESMILGMKLETSRSIALWWREPITLKDFFTFPDPVNALESRIHSGLAVVIIIISNALYFSTGKSFWYLDLILLYGFVARTLCGPRLDPQAFLVLFVLRPLVEDYFHWSKSEFRPGQPYHFAHMVGCIMTSCGLAVHLTGNEIATLCVFAPFAIIALIACLLDWCVGCKIFQLLVKIKVVPASQCDQCVLTYQTKRSSRAIIQPKKLEDP